MIVFVTALSVACLVLTGAILTAGLLLVGRRGPTGPSVQYAIIAGIAEVGGAAMYLVWLNVGGSASFTAANTLLMLGPVMIPLAFHSLHPTGLSRLCVAVASACVVVVSVASVLLTAHAASIVRVVAFAIVCACAVVTAMRLSESGRWSIRLMAAGLGFYAAYCIVRAPVLVSTGPDGFATAGIFSDPGAITAGIVALAAITAGTVGHWITLRVEARRALAAPTTLTFRETARGDALHASVHIGELVDEIRSAALAVDAGAVPVDNGVRLSTAGAAIALFQLLRHDHGWSDAEIALVQSIPEPADRSRGESAASALDG